VLDPSTLKDLVPDFKAKGAPLATEVHGDDIYFLTRYGEVPPADHAAVLPEPRQLHHLAQPVREVARPGLVEAEGIDIFTGFPRPEVLFDGETVAGVRTGDRGIDKHAGRRSRRSSPASTSAPRSRSSPTACAAT
jgi:electron-transferring-flavoprotein dehydrogenase